MRFSSFLLSLAVGTALTTAVPAANPSPTQAPIKPAKTRTKSSTHSPTSSAGLLAVDINTARPSSFWTCLAKTHQKVVIKGYGQACKHGGAVDKDFVRSYEAAKAVGIPHIDAYMFPCTGKQPTGLACKTPATQIAEFEAAIAAANMTLDSVWLDVEPGPDSGRPCAAWNLTPKTKNLALARQYVDLIRKSSLRWGVYANG
ncbi:hypothetical protein MMC19_007035 [Ptychographa xylographoides]|nr:hypothetical protein [Ptychographa xylographoides]